MRLYDAHNHLQDERFAGRQPELVDAARSAGVVGMVVNGSCEEDWPAVAELARRFPDLVVPSFGLHPWYVHERSSRWWDDLRRYLDDTPGAVVGEIGIDRWILDCPPAARSAIAGHLGEMQAASLDEQAEVFVRQFEEAATRGVAASVHCLQAWGRLHELLGAVLRPACGFLLHSYGGPREMIAGWVRLGAYFGFPGYFLHARKLRQREAFRAVPSGRLLVETDAPDQRLPVTTEWREPGTAAGAEWSPREASDPEGRSLNPPENLRWVYAGLAEVLGEATEALERGVEAAFRGLFGEPGECNRPRVQPPR